MKLKSFIFLVVVACMLISCKDNKKLISEYEQALAMEDYDRAEEILDEIDEFSLTDAEVEHLERLSQEKMYEELDELEELMNDLDYDDYSYDYDDYDEDDRVTMAYRKKKPVRLTFSISKPKNLHYFM